MYFISPLTRWEKERYRGDTFSVPLGNALMKTVKTFIRMTARFLYRGF